MTEAGLSFLGLGDPNIISWGQMISSGKDIMVKCPWVSAIPGVSVILTVLTFFMIGEGMNRFISPKMQDTKLYKGRKQTVKRATDNERRYAPREGSIPPVLLSGVSKGACPLAHGFACKV